MRDYWLNMLNRVSRPILVAGAARSLKRDMPVEAKYPNGDRAKFTHLEAIARLLAGAAPCIELQQDEVGHSLGAMAIETLASCFDQQSADHLDFDAGQQVIVDAAFLAHAFLRSPNALWGKLDGRTQSRIVEAMLSLRARAPHFNNWLLFAAMVEAFLKKVAGMAFDPMRVDYALRQHEQWYAGGGWYKDGPGFHHDYYNSYVIQPMLLDIADAVADTSGPLSVFVNEKLPEWRSRAVRFAAIQERHIAPDGSFPVVGRSITYRSGAFQHLAMMAQRHELPAGVSPGQVRKALTAVIRKTLDVPGTFDTNGFLAIGLSGHQVELAEGYISTGSLYLAATVFLPLGLPSTDAFWTAPDSPTTWERAWGGVDLESDHD